MPEIRLSNRSMVKSEFRFRHKVHLPSFLQLQQNESDFFTTKSCLLRKLIIFTYTVRHIENETLLDTDRQFHLLIIDTKFGIQFFKNNFITKNMENTKIKEYVYLMTTYI